MKNTKLTKNLNLLMICELFFEVSDIFSSTFLIAYFYELTAQNLCVISAYYLVAYLLTGLCFWLFGDLIKTKSKLSVYRFGIIINCFYMFLLLILGEGVKSHYLLLGVVYGISLGVYWSACHNIINSFATTSNCKKYITTREIFINIIRIVLPFILGTSIHFASFMQVSIAIFIITILQIIFSLFIKVEDMNNIPISSFNLLSYLSTLKKMGNKAKKVIHFYQFIFFAAITEGAMATLITVMIMMTFSNTLNLGILTTIFSLCTVITIYLFQRFYHKSQCKKCIYTCLIFMLFSTLILVFDINKFSVVFYNFCNSIFIIILSNLGYIQRYNCINDIGLSDYTSEHQAFSEICLAFGRILAYGLLLIVGSFHNPIIFSALLVLFALCFIPYSFQILAMENT